MNNSLSIKGILFDLDGVLYTGTSPIEGAVDTIKAIRTSGMPCRFVTNTSTLSLATLHKKINALGFDIPANELISAPQATLLYLRKQHHPVCRLLLAEDVKQDFNEFPQSEANPDYIVIGDIGNAWYYSGSQCSISFSLPVTMRTTPAVSYASGAYYTIYRNSATNIINDFLIDQPTTNFVTLYNATQASGTAGQSGLIRITNSAGFVAMTAEL